MANETWKFVQAKSKQAMKQVLGIRDEKARMKVTPPLAVAPITQEDDMRWNPKSFVKNVRYPRPTLLLRLPPLLRLRLPSGLPVCIIVLSHACFSVSSLRACQRPCPRAGP